MKHFVMTMFLAAAAATAVAQTAPKPATTIHKPATTSGVKLPPGVPPVRGLVKTAFSLRYQDVKIGTGADAEPYKMYKVRYTGWVASDGHKFDSSDDHRTPVLDKNGKPVMGDDGKPKLGDPVPASFPVGFGRMIPGFDQGFNGMKVGGKRRLFIPWQLGYGERGHPGPDAAHPGIPPKADLIFDVELVEITDLQMPANHPGMGSMPGHPGMGVPPGHVTVNPGAPGTTATPPSPGQPAAPAAPAKPAAPAPQAGGQVQAPAQKPAPTSSPAPQ